MFNTVLTPIDWIFLDSPRLCDTAKNSSNFPVTILLKSSENSSPPKDLEWTATSSLEAASNMIVREKPL